MASGFVGEIGDSQIFPTPLLFNNTITIQIASNSFFYEHIDHIDVDWHSIREMLGGHLISLPHISKKNQTNDVFTKVLSHVPINLWLTNWCLLIVQHQFEGNVKELSKNILFPNIGDLIVISNLKHLTIHNYTILSIGEIIVIYLI